MILNLFNVTVLECSLNVDVCVYEVSLTKLCDLIFWSSLKKCEFYYMEGLERIKFIFSLDKHSRT
jgi:hypothetical protein